jgi:RNase H-fold protein (predicted Holliday junction resolvase)
MKEAHETSQLIGMLERITKDQDESIAVLQENLRTYAAEIVRLRSGAKGALSALRTGQAIDVVAAIQILRGLE